MASLQNNLMKTVSERQTILGFDNVIIKAIPPQRLQQIRKFGVKQCLKTSEERS